MHYQTVLFDLDGTLTDPREGITRSIQFALGNWVSMSRT
jgi:phosphoglycolate phosphatase